MAAQRGKAGPGREASRRNGLPRRQLSLATVRASNNYAPDVFHTHKENNNFMSKNRWRSKTFGCFPISLQATTSSSFLDADQQPTHSSKACPGIPYSFVESKIRTYHGQVEPGRRKAGRRRGAGSGKTGRRRVGSPRTQPSLLPPRASKTIVPNVFFESTNKGNLI